MEYWSIAPGRNCTRFREVGDAFRAMLALLTQG